MGCFITVEDGVVGFMVSNPWAVPATLLFSLIELRLHPTPMKHTPTYEFTVSFAGAAAGCSVGMARTWAVQFVPGVLIRSMPFGAIWLARRIALGLASAFVAKEVAKRVLTLGLPLLYQYFPIALRSLWQPPVKDLGAKLKRDVRLSRVPHTEDGRPWDVEITARFFAYFALAWTVAEPVPKFFKWAGW